MLGPGNLEFVFGRGQLFVRRKIHGKIILLIAKVTDDFIIGGMTEKLRTLYKQ